MFQRLSIAVRAPPKAGQKPARPPKLPKRRPVNGEAAVCGSYEQRKRKRLFLDIWKASFCGSNMEQTHGEFIDLHKKNGVDLPSCYHSNKACARFLVNIYAEIHEDILRDMREARNLPVLIDGATDCAILEMETEAYALTVRKLPGGGRVWYHGRLYSTKSQHPSLGDIAAEIKAGRITNVIIMAGAGISTPSGIPDFRTPGTGLYDNLAKYNLPYAEAVFDLDYFSGDPKPFFTLAKDLYHEGRYHPNIVHHFVRLLSDKAILQKMYTQNIDGLERAAGIPEDKLVEAHGTFATATCQKCRKRYDGDYIKGAILQNYEKDLIILERISSTIHNASMTEKSKQKQQMTRQQQRTNYCVEGQWVCREKSFLHWISQDELTSLLKHYKEFRLTPRYKKSGGQCTADVRLLTHADIARVVAFLINLAEDHALMLPGRIPGFRRFDIKLLPSNYTKASIWRIDTAAMEAAGERAVKIDSFRKLRRTLVP
ncbi:hypothetical protein LSAT2_020106 [Lamellibrachia satsuma]|nr:hypothetical protein LSAT2_020106 [Lamellibrachia satsuma]